MQEHLSTEQENTTLNSPRRPIFAALMSAALPGLGQLYNGEFNKAIWIFLLFSITAIPLVMIIALLLPAMLTLPLVVLSTAITIGIWIFAIVDGWRVATRRQSFQTRVWQTSGVYTLVFVICATVILPSTLLWVRKHQVEPFYIPSGSMEPSVLRGDFVFASKSYNCPNCFQSVKRGDVAIFVYPDNRNLHYVKRVIGLPGDTINIDGTTVSVNGERLNTDAKPNTETFKDTSWRVQWSVDSGSVDSSSVDSGSADSGSFDSGSADSGSADSDSNIESENSTAGVIEITVNPGHAFVLGDNRSRSNDSRVFGQVPLSDIVGKVRQVWFSKSQDGIRWSRIGQLINQSGQQDDGD